MRGVRHWAHPSEKLFLLLRLALAAIGVTRCGDFEVVAHDALENGTNARKEENKSKPVVPHICRDHVLKRSEWRGLTALCRGVLAENFIPETALKTVQEALGEFIVGCFCADGNTQFGVEFKGPLAIAADLEVGQNEL